MAHDFRQIDARNIAPLSDMFEVYSGRPLHKEGILRSADSCPAWSVWDGDRALGFYYTLRFAQDVLKLTHIYVSPEARHQGVGSAMLQHVFDVMGPPYASVIAVNSALFQTREAKTDPEPFYTRHGFTTIAQTEHSKVFWKSK
ncbi:MAG: GNAT family N-acetyltransferase [Pseudomonadota bacterium]